MLGVDHDVCISWFLVALSVLKITRTPSCYHVIRLLCMNMRRHVSGVNLNTTDISLPTTTRRDTDSERLSPPRLIAVDMKFPIHIHIHIHIFSVDIHGYIHIHR